jgi:hypothetical protein
MNFTLFTWGTTLNLERMYAYRKALQLYVEPTWGIMFGWGTQYLKLGTSKWEDYISSGHHVSLTKHFGLGHNHGWYDGPHCGFDVGFLHFLWHNNHCKRCHE